MTILRDGQTDKDNHVLGTVAPTALAISGTSAEAGPLDPGKYDISADVDFWYIRGATGLTAVKATHHPIYSGGYEEIKVHDATDNYIAAITDAGVTGLMKISRKTG